MATLDTDEGWNQYLDDSEDTDADSVGAFAAECAVAAAFVIATWAVLNGLNWLAGGAW